MTNSESDVEHTSLDWLEDLGWQVARGVDITGDVLESIRENISQVELDSQSRDALARLSQALRAF